ncbi:MAG: 23S rRNA (guanosine(2251)-2'-O)-methyltransferase RlmB [Bacteroidota bacterium]
MRKQNIIYGRHPVLDALKEGQSIDKILLQKGTRGIYEKELRDLASREHIPVQMVPKEKLNRVTGGTHQGVIAFAALVAYQRLESILPFLFEQSQTPLIVLLDSITDVRNFGAIARSAECMGAHALVVGARSAAPINAESLKTSAGALGRIPVCREASLSLAIKQLQLSGLSVFASDLQAEKKLPDLDLTVPAAILLGSEGDGVHPSLLRKTDERFIIPQLGQTDSLNVSVASGVILYEAMRQRMAE